MPADQKHDDERHKMMITNSKEENSPPKLAAPSSSSSSATPWLRLKDPRIVRVSRAFGGKDRHSKVCTIRGLRDRRVRLSVTTAIQLYDLQDRLGLNQPSKVVDWLLNAAKDEIDELPPLPIPSASLGLHYQSMLPAHTSTHPHRTSEFKINCNNSTNNGIDKADDEAEDHKSNNSIPAHPSSSSSFSALLNNVASASPFGYHHWGEPSSSSTTNNLPLFFTSQAEDLHNFNNVNLSLPSPLSLSTGSQYLEFNHHLHQNFLMNNPLHSMNQQSAVRPFHFSMAPKFVSSQEIKNNNGDRANKDDDHDDGFGSDDQ